VHIDPKLGFPLLIGEFIGYGIVFIALRMLFARYGQPLFESLAWIPQPFRPLHLAVLGLILAVVVVVLGNVLGFPNDVDTPFDKLLNDPLSRIAIALFGITIGPIVEELLFSRVPATCAGELVRRAAGDSGNLGDLRRHAPDAERVSLAERRADRAGRFRARRGAACSGSTRASAITHVAYNALPFLC